MGISSLCSRRLALGEERLGMCRADKAMGYLALPLDCIAQLGATDPDMEVGISYNIVEVRDAEPVLRELRVDITTPACFDPIADL